MNGNVRSSSSTVRPTIQGNALHSPGLDAVSTRRVARGPLSETKRVLLTRVRVAHLPINGSGQQQVVTIRVEDDLAVLVQAHDLAFANGCRDRASRRTGVIAGTPTPPPVSATQ